MNKSVTSNGLGAMPVPLTDQSRSLLAPSNKAPLAIEFWSFRCEACRKTAPVVSQIATAMAGKLTVYKVNADENPRLVAEYNVPFVPYLVIQDGKGVTAFAEEWTLEQVQAALNGKAS